MPVVRTDGRSGGRSVYGHLITKFSWMGRLPYFLTHSAPLGAFRTRGFELSGVDCSCIVPIDSDPGDDTKGKERCDKDNCTLGYYPVTEQIVSQPTSPSLSTVLIITSDIWLSTNQ